MASGLSSEPTDVSMCCVYDTDSLPSKDVDAVVVYRTTKPPLHMQTSSVTVCCIAKLTDKDKSWHVRGFADKVTVLTINDGSHDHFSSMPASVKKRFTSTQAIRDHMDFGTEGKLFAIVLEQYTSKGIYRYELSNLKVRSGYGKGSMARIPAQGPTQQDANRFFGTSAVVTANAPASTTTDEIRAEPSDTVMTKHDEATSYEKHNDHAGDGEETPRESMCIRDAPSMLLSQPVMTDHDSLPMPSSISKQPLSLTTDVKCDVIDDMDPNVTSTSKLPLNLFHYCWLVKLYVFPPVGKAILNIDIYIYILSSNC